MSSCWERRCINKWDYALKDKHDLLKIVYNFLGSRYVLVVCWFC